MKILNGNPNFRRIAVFNGGNEMNLITLGVLVSITTLILNLRRIFKWLRILISILKGCFQKEKKEIIELKNQNQEYIRRISELESQNRELERKTLIMDDVPPDYSLIYNNILLEKKSGIQYCWNCWNKVNGRERRVLEGDEYSVSCRVCGIHTQLKDYPNQPRYAVPE